ncbi:type II toxin-antitoxin system death-on-curing family toxin [Gemmobacter sp.]|uniref:type II toxin-antitoxin system death-on-curing family toxin n=1 Tax=Gemmobacter sp. TaxID=1898957 RepID=UPI002AFE15D3|nr:type II toxin-antitoxin system death-on-curing family toxin [Gemmobacter sp.]
MNFVLLSPQVVVALHDAALNPGELSGLARDKSLEGALARVDNRLAYGMIVDVFDLAAAYAAAVAQGHCFNDGNKRTAFESMSFCLEMHGIVLDWPAQEIGDLIIALAQRRTDDAALADWLRARV